MVKARVSPWPAGLEHFDVAAQNAHAQRVESGDQRLRERRVAEQPIHALGHFAGGFVGEGDGQNRVGRDILFLDEPGDAVCDHARLARSGAGQDQQRAVGGFDCGALFGIEMVEERMQGVASGGKVPESSLSFGLRLYRHIGVAALRAKIVSDETEDDGCGKPLPRTTTKYGAIFAATPRAGANFPDFVVARR